MLRVVSFNVNGLRAVCRKEVFQSPFWKSVDLVCVQEVKAQEPQLEGLFSEKPLSLFSVCSAVKKGYSGVCFLSNQNFSCEIVDVREWMGAYFEEGRVQVCRYNDNIFINVYVPSLSAVFETDQWDSRLNYKRSFIEDLVVMGHFFIKEGFNVVVCGDFNVAHRDKDLARPVQNRGRAGFTDEEKALLDLMIDQGYCDVFRMMNPLEEKVYSWWSYRGQARLKNVGWRLDYFWMNDNCRLQVRQCYYLSQMQGSDHCPVVFEFDVEK